MTGGTNAGGSGRLTAIVAATYPEDSVCTVTNGTRTLKARDTSGTTLFNVTPGDWTVASTTTDGETLSKSVSIEESGQVEFVTLLQADLFANGNQCEAVTGGWEFNKDYTLGGSGYGSVTIGDYLTVSAGEGKSTTVSTKNSIYITPFKTLKCNVTSSTNSVFLGLTTMTSGAVQDEKLYAIVSGTGEKSYDISAITGKYYIYIGVSNGRTAKVDKVWLE